MKSSTEQANNLQKTGGNFISLLGASGQGKCLGKGTLVLMADGTTLPVEEIQEGDFVMGDDSTARRVLNTTAGRSKLYRLTSKWGESWVCNDAHVLTLKCAVSRPNRSGKSISSNYTKGRVIDQSIGDYMAASKQHRNCFKQFRVGWELPESNVEHDPYIYGLWLADGGWDSPILHKPEGPQARRWCEYFTALGYRIHVGYNSTGCPAWCVRQYGPAGGGGAENHFTRFIRSSVNERREKFIRPEYVRGSKAQRAALLAGLIDGDGSLTDGGGYEIMTKHRHLADSIKYLGNSLGHRVNVAPCQKGIKSTGFVGDYFRCTICGPCKFPVLAKPPKKRTGFGDSSLSKITIKTESEDGEYYGFMLDGNHRFLLADGTVTHNSFSPLVYFLLEWIADAGGTRVDLVSTDEEKLKSAVYAKLVQLHGAASLVLPGECKAMTVSLDPKVGFGFHCRLIKRGEVNGGELKGAHRTGRNVPHPIYGPSTRRFVLIDEAQQVSDNVFPQIPNVLASNSASGAIARPRVPVPTLEECRELQRIFAVMKAGLGTGDAPPSATMEQAALRAWTIISTAAPDYLRQNPLAAAAGQNDFCLGFVAWLVQSGRRIEAATCLWPAEIFTAEPRSVRLVWSALDAAAGNVMVVLTANPTDMASQYGQNCCPVAGWDAVGDADTWLSRTGARCVRLDVRKSENYRQRKEVFANFQTYDGAQAMLAQCGGDENHPDMWSYVYGMFPPNGPMASLIAARWVAAAEGEWQFDTITTPLAGCDVALTGDAPTLAYGRAGRAVAWKPWGAPETRLEQPLWAVQIDGVVTLPHGDTQEVADAYMARLKQLGVAPECCAVDFTGMPGVGDVMRHQWRQKVGQVPGQSGVVGPVDLLRVVYSEKPSERRIVTEDSKTPLEMFTNRATELWFRAAKYFETGILRLGRAIGQETVKQLTTRKAGRSTTDGKKQRIEPKDEHKRRLKGKSPDEADAVCLLCDAASQSIAALVVKSKDTQIPPPPAWARQEATVNRYGLLEQPVEIPGFEGGGDLETLGQPRQDGDEAGEAARFPDGVKWEW